MKYFLLTLSLVCSVFTSFAHNVELKKGFVQALVTDQLNEPTSIAFANDGRIFITERAGAVRIIENNQLLDEPFLNVETDLAGERGLSSILLDPNFDINGFVYIYYTVPELDYNRLSRFKANGNRVIPGSETILLELDKMNGIFHNGGAMRFASDGTIFLAVGDGLAHDKAQTLDNLLGKMLRLNSDGSIPQDNPYYNELEGKFRAIYSYGLRNSFTFDLNPETDQILANDVGLVTWEEINDIQPKKNYGWPIIEGPLNGQTPPDDYKDPVFAFPHQQGQCAIVGGAFYQPEQSNFPPEYLGKYIFSDYCTGIFRVIDSQGNLQDTLLKGADFVSNLATSPDGYLYYASFSEGELWRVSYIGEGQPFISKQPKDVLAVVGENVSFGIEDFGNQPIEYKWYKNNIEIAGAIEAEINLSNVQFTDSAATFHCVISNPLGTVSSDTAQLLVTTNNRPIPSITLPISQSKYNNGDTLWFQGSATDPEEGLLNPSQLTWKIDFHHDEHAHPAMPNTSGINNGYYVIPKIGETDTNVWYNVYLTATDSKGIQQSVNHEIFPNHVETYMATTPGNFDLLLDGALFPTPYTFKSTVNNSRVIGTPEFQIRNDSLFKFVQWSNGDTAKSIPFDAGTRTTFIAEYEYVRRFYEGDGDGILAEYYRNYNFSPPVSDSIYEENINFFWDYVAPVSYTFPGDSFSVVFTGSLMAPITGEYTFTVAYDDKAEFYLNNELIVDGSDGVNGAIKESLPVTLEGGKRYNIRMTYVELLYISRIKLYWSFVDQPTQIVPAPFFYRDTVTSIDDTVKVLSGDFSIFPNPSSNLLNVTWHDELKSQKEVFVYGVAGNQISKHIWEKDDRNLELNVSALKEGMYIIKVISNGESLQKSFIKQ